MKNKWLWPVVGISLAVMLAVGFVGLDWYRAGLMRETMKAVQGIGAAGDGLLLGVKDWLLCASKHGGMSKAYGKANRRSPYCRKEWHAVDQKGDEFARLISVLNNKCAHNVWSDRSVSSTCYFLSVAYKKLHDEIVSANFVAVERNAEYRERLRRELQSKAWEYYSVEKSNLNGEIVHGLLVKQSMLR